MNDNEQATLAKRVDDMVYAFRTIGLFEDSVKFPEPERQIALVSFLIGDRAFSDRVQNPEKVDIDAEFARMMAPVNNDVSEEIKGLREMLG